MFFAMRLLFVVMLCGVAACSNNAVHTLHRVPGLALGTYLETYVDARAGQVLGDVNGTRCVLLSTTASALPPGRYAIVQARRNATPLGGARLLRLPDWMRPLQVALQVDLYLGAASGEAQLRCERVYTHNQGARYPSAQDIRAALRGSATLGAATN